MKLERMSEIETNDIQIAYLDDDTDALMAGRESL